MLFGLGVICAVVSLMALGVAEFVFGPVPDGWYYIQIVVGPPVASVPFAARLRWATVFVAGYGVLVDALLVGALIFVLTGAGQGAGTVSLGP